MASDGLTAKVLFEYIAEQDDELTINIGDIITNVQQLEGGWWKGETNDKRGMFPENFVAIVKVQPPSKDEVKTPFSSKAEVKTPFSSKAEVKFDYDPEQGDELALTKGTIIDVLDTADEGWWRGRYQGKEGMFPSNFVVAQEASKSSEPIDKPLPIPDTEQGRPPEHNTESPHPQPTQSKIANMFAGIKPADLLKDRLKKVTKPGIIDQKSDEPAPGEASNQTEAVKPTQKVQPMNLEIEKIKDKKGPMMPAPSGLAASKKTLQKAKAIFDYDPEQDDELRIAIGDIITIINSELTFEGWMKGEVNGKVGVFPDNFVELLPVEHSEQPVVEPVKEEPVPKPQGGPMLPPSAKPLQSELTKKLAQKSTVNNNPPAMQPKKANKAPPPLPGAKPALIPGTKPKPQLPHNKPVKPPAPMSKTDTKPVTPSVDAVDAKSHNQPSSQKNETKPVLPKAEPKSPAVNTSNPIVPKNEIKSHTLPNDDNILAVQMSPKNEAKPDISPSNKNPSMDELKTETHQIKNANEHIEPVTIPKSPSTPFVEKSPRDKQSDIRRSLVLSDAVKESFLQKSISAPNINEEIKKDDLNTASDHKKLTGLPSLKLCDVKPTDPLKHMQRAKPPSKSPPSKYKDKQHHFDAPFTVVDDMEEVNELKSQVTELQTKMVDMEKKFKKLLTQVTDDLSNERKLRLNQQVEIDSLNKKLNVFLD